MATTRGLLGTCQGAIKVHNLNAFSKDNFQWISTASYQAGVQLGVLATQFNEQPIPAS